jgi:hypothetical protein
MAAQVWLNANLVSLQKAVLCTDCEVISEGLNGRCTGCGSQSLLRVSKVLGGTIESKQPLGFPRLGHVVNDDLRLRSLSAAA